MHTAMIPEQVKTMKIQAGIQVSRPRDLRRQLQLWKRFGRLHLIVFVLVRNIIISDKVKTRQGYKAAFPIKESFVKSSEMLENQENVKSRSDKGYHAVPPPYTRNYIPPKLDQMFIDNKLKGNPQQKEYKEKEVIDSDGKGRISGKGKIKTGTLDFDDVYFWIKREFSVARTPQQNGVTERKNKTLIEAVKTMLDDFKLPTTFWAEAVNTVCYVLNRNKKDERGIVIKNKAGLVAQGHTQEEGIDYDEVFAPVARMEAIRLFLAYASFKDFVVYQMDVKSGFQYKKIEAKVYVCQPPRFEDPYFPNKVYKVEKALYGLHQALRAWYETLSTYLMDNGFYRGQIDKILFIKRHKDNILLVQVYIDDIIFGSTRKELTSTPTKPNKALVKDAKAENADVHLYRSMIGSLMYLTASRPDITFVVCACARFQVTPKTSHLHVVKRIFRYLKGQPKLGLWYHRDSPFDLEAYFDSDYAGASLNRKSTTGGCQFLNKRMMIVKDGRCFMDKFAVKTGNSSLNTASMIYYCQAKVTQISQSSGPTNLVADETIYKEWEDNIERVSTTGSSLEAEQDIGSGPRCQVTILRGAEAQTRFEVASKQSNDLPLSRDKQVKGMAKHKEIYVISSHTKKVFANMRRQGQGFSGNVTHLFETMMVNAQEEVGEGSGLHIDSHHTPTDTQPSSSKSQKKIKPKRNQRQAAKVLDLEEAKIAQAKEIAKLKKKVKKLEKKRKSRPAGLRRLKKVGSKISLVDESQERMHDGDMFRVDDLKGNEVIVDVREKIVEKEVSTTDPVTTAGEVVTAANVEDSVAPTTATTADVDDELTLENTLTAIKAAKPKVISTAIITPRAKAFEKKDQITLDEEVARKLEVEMGAEIEEEEMIEKEKDKENRAVIEEWDDVQATIDDDRQLAEQIQAQERDQLSIKERSKLLVELIESIREYFAAKRAEEIINKPPTKAQQKSLMCTYMRNMEGFKQKD
uniref:Reverse transcriptase Ty1/copia-type domain-containing protein n=1 Tax=Tanacetum cinerariifolium TaxID=118510 RepID=A0A6L2L2C3_TANCI|nr:hypothetical protein [Tanacetum cinerariifolium]